MDILSVPCFFLAANAPSGFCSRFGKMYDPNGDWRCTIIKGGPGTGKSTMLKKAAGQAAANGETIELIFCSSDPRSLDGIILPESHKCMADGTAPHVMEPLYPGACETLFNPGDCWDRSMLFAHREDIRTLNRQVAACHKRAGQIRKTAGAMMDDARAMAKSALDTARLDLYCNRLCRRLFRGIKQGDGAEYPRFLSGITPEGWIVFDHTLPLYAERIALISDDVGIAAPVILAAIRDAALAHGCTVIACYSPMYPDELEAVILPERREAFAMTNRFLRYGFIPERTIHTRRFSDPLRRTQVRSEIRARLKAVGELLDEVADTLQQARVLHDQLEAFYIAAMDYEKLEARSTAMIETWLSE